MYVCSICMYTVYVCMYVCMLFCLSHRNFIGCPYQTPGALTVATPSFPYGSGDQFKSQLQFAEFCVSDTHPNPPQPRQPISTPA